MWIVPPRQTPTRVQFEGFFLERIGRLPEQILECSSPVAAREMLLGGQRLSMMSKQQVHRELTDGRLLNLLADIPGTEREIGLTIRKDWKPTRVRAAFIEKLKEVIHENC